MASRAPTIPQDARNEPVPPPPTLNTGFPPNQPLNQPHRNRRRAASPTAVNNITAGIPAQNDHLNLPVPGGLNNQLVVGGLSNLPNRLVAGGLNNQPNQLVAGGLNNHPHQPVAGSLHLPNFPVPEGLNNLPHGRNNIRHIAEYFEDIMETLYNTQVTIQTSPFFNRKSPQLPTFFILVFFWFFFCLKREYSWITWSINPLLALP